MAKEKAKDDAAPGEGGAAEATEKKSKGPKGEKPAGDAAAPKAPKKPKKEASATDDAPKSKRRGHPPRKQSKRYRKAFEMRPAEPLAIGDAVKTLKKMDAGTKKDRTVNIVMWLGIDPKHADQAIRGAVSLPKGIGKTMKVICFAEGEDADAAKAAGAIEVGSDDLIKKISDGWQDFDVAVAHPRLMGKVGKLGRVLGPSGKMPSPKNGTVTPEVSNAVREFAAGKVEFRNDTLGNVHAVVGKLSFPEADLAANIEHFVEHIRKMKPQSSKGVYIRKACVNAAMSPSVELKVAS